VSRHLHVINANNLIDPADERRYFDVDTRYLNSTTSETPTHQTAQLVITFVFADQRTATIALTGIVARFSTSAETGGGHDEYLLGDGVDLPHAFTFADHGHVGLPHSQWDRSSFSHVAVAGYGAPATRCRYGASGRQADDADAGFQLSLALKFQQGDVIVQCLAVVVVMDVGGGHAQCLCSGTAVSAGQIVISNADVDGVTRAHDVCDTVSSCEDPLGSDQRPSTQVLIHRVDQCHLPAEFAGQSIGTADHPTSATSRRKRIDDGSGINTICGGKTAKFPVGSFNSADEFTVGRRFWPRRSMSLCRRRRRRRRRHRRLRHRYRSRAH